MLIHHTIDTSNTTKVDITVSTLPQTRGNSNITIVGYAIIVDIIAVKLKNCFIAIRFNFNSDFSLSGQQ